MTSQTSTKTSTKTTTKTTTDLGSLEPLDLDLDASLVEILRRLVRPEKTVPPAKLPLPAIITSDDRSALESLPDVYGQVVPTEARALTPSEISALHTERSVLDQIEKLAAQRKADIRTTLLNHFDTHVREEGSEGVEVDKEGHYLLAAEEPVQGTRRKFTWEIRSGDPTVSVSELEKICADPESGFVREDYLALTEAPKGRTFSEEKALKALKANPGLFTLLARAANPGKLIGSFYVRNQK